MTGVQTCALPIYLFEGSEVFAFEFEIVEFEGEAFQRGFDELTGLYLWQP